MHAKPKLPAGHGEVLTLPAYASWAQLARDNHRNAESWRFSVSGMSATELRALARREALEAASAFSERLGVTLTDRRDPEGLVVATGHQPEFYHPGVWIKDFLLQRLAEETEAAAFDVVVDTDGFDALGVSSPCMAPGVERCRQNLAVGGPMATYGGTPVPSVDEIDDFCSAVGGVLSTLPAPAIASHFSAFCAELSAASAVAENLAELVTIARRRYEASADTDYLELPMTWLVRSRAFGRFVRDIAVNADRFRAAYNGELGQYRSVNKTRNAAQPFPDLGREGERIELPLWSIVGPSRSSVWVEPRSDGGVRFLSGAGESLVECAAEQDLAEALAGAGIVFAPKALLLTLFVRLFCCDLFIHGVGGGRYDSVTDGVCRRYFDVEPPAFVVASITMYLPLGAHVVTDEEIAEAKDRLNRLDHNPDALLGEVEFDSATEREAAVALAAEKTELVAAIARADADRKSLGLRIKETNAQLAELLAPLKRGLLDDLAVLETQRAAAEILTDRTYPFCLWSPQEVADKAR